jgi:putative ABC transport system permease protein
MNIASLIRMSFRSIMRNRMRSLLTTLGVIIGVCSVIIMVAVGRVPRKRYGATSHPWAPTCSRYPPRGRSRRTGSASPT